MAKKMPRLDEVFIVSPKPINIGTAYSLKNEAGFPNKKNLQHRTYGSNIKEAGLGNPSVAPHHKLRPEFEKLVSATAQNILSKKPDKLELEDMLRDMAHGIEAAEGEDPKELDQGGPKPGTTGGK